MQSPLYLDAPIDEEDITLKDVISSSDNIEEEVLNRSLKEDIKVLYAPLNERQLYAIKKYFGIENDKTSTLVEIGKELGVSPERTRQIIDRALRDMKRYARKPE